MQTSGWQLPTQTASLFGKLPTVLDYVRIDHSFPAAIALDTFLSRAIQDLAVSNLSWPEARQRFVFAPTGVDHALVGVIGKSRDRAGRKFPLSIYAPLPIGALAHGFARLPFACDGFFAAADALIDDAPQLTRDAAAERLKELPMPNAENWQEAFGKMQHSLQALATPEFDAALFSGDAAAREAGLARLAQAAAQSREAPLDKPTVLDLPARDANDVSAWLLALEAQLAWTRSAPTFFWSEQGDPLRLLVSLGPPPAQLPLWMADKKRKADRLLSLWTLADATSGVAATGEPPVHDGAEPNLWDTVHALAGGIEGAL